MSKLTAQMALFGVIDELVKTNDLEVVETVEEFLPGWTVPGKRGWFGEVKEFLTRPELAPRAQDPSSHRPRSADMMFPSLEAAVGELKVDQSGGPPLPPDGPPSRDAQTPTDVARSLFAATVLSKVLDVLKQKEKDKDRHWFPDLPEGFDPLRELLPQNIRPPSSDSAPIPGLDLPPGGDPAPRVRDYLAEARNRNDFQTKMHVLAAHGVIDQSVADAQPVCSGGLRKINGQFCAVLTTDYPRPDLTVEDIKRVIEPHNWPTLCPDFFRGIEDQNPVTRRGWNRVLETVSADPSLWELRTALRYWKGETTPEGGFYINYDLDPDRAGDCMMVMVDAGYLMITPVDANNPAAGVRIRTSKEVRIRGLSSTAAAVLACLMGWGDVSSHMLTDKAKPPFPGAVNFGAASVDPGKQPGDATQTAMHADDKPTEEATELAAEQTELPKGWRNALISGFQRELNDFINNVAVVGASDLYKRWSDGMTAKDVEEFGAQFGKDVTNYAAGLLNVAANATSPPDNPDANSGGV
jgi:hypothetical protein